MGNIAHFAITSDALSEKEVQTLFDAYQEQFDFDIHPSCKHSPDYTPPPPPTTTLAPDPKKADVLTEQTASAATGVHRQFAIVYYLLGTTLATVSFATTEM